MKRLALSALCAVLCGAGLIYLSACAQQKSPLSPNPALLGANTGRDSGLTALLDGFIMSQNSILRIQMSQPVDPVTVNASTVKVYQIADDGLSEAAYAYFVFSYDAASRRINIAPDPNHNSGNWDNNKNYRLELTAGITNIVGQALDGNGNQLAEGTAFDNFTRDFAIGTPAAGATYSLFPIRLTTVTLQAPNGPFSLYASNTSQNAGNVQTQYSPGVPSYVTLTATFSDNLDQSTVWVDDSTLHANLSLLDSSNNPAPVVAGSVTRTANSITAAFNLQPASRYAFKIVGGTNGVRSSQEPWEKVLRGRYFAGQLGALTLGYTYAAEAIDGTLPSYIDTQQANGADSTPPTLGLCYYQASWTPNYWRLMFSLSGSRTLDPATLTTANFYLVSGSSQNFDPTDPNQNYNVIIPAKVEYDPGFNEVDLYMPSQFPTRLSDGGGNFAWVKVMVLHTVKSLDGIGFDGNGDGAGGMADDDQIYGDNGANARKFYSQ
jgi:hypothetical protein